MKKKINLTRKKKVSLSDLGKSTVKFTGNEDHNISLQEASIMTRIYRETHPNQTIAHFFGKKAIMDILNQSNCVGIRIYYANDPATGQKHLIIIGAESNMNDITYGYIADRSIPCPSFCSTPNQLNN